MPWLTLGGLQVKNPVFVPALFDNLVSPTVAACVAAALRVKPEWAMGLLLCHITPPTIAGQHTAPHPRNFPGFQLHC